MNSRKCTNIKQISRNGAKSKCKLKAVHAGKENVYPIKKTRNILPTNQAENVLREVKSSAAKTLINVKTTFDHITERLRNTGKRRCSTSSAQQYRQIDNNQDTPVKLYSPFDIITPSPAKKKYTPPRRRLTPKRFMFVSPTGKLKTDIEDLSSGIAELHTVAESLKERKSK